MAKMMMLMLGLLLATASGDPTQTNLRSSPVNKTAPPLAPEVVNQAVIKGQDADNTPDVAADDDAEVPEVEETTAPTGFLPAQNNKAVPADPTLKDMEAAMTSLMLGNSAFGATPMGGSVKQIKNLITKTMIPKVMAAHKSDVKLINKLYGAFAKCKGAMMRSRRGANKQIATYNANSRSHKSCRSDEAVKFTTKKNCLTQQKNLFLIKKGKCDTFTTLVGKIGTTKDNRAIVTKAGGESIESYITRISTTICGKHTHGKYGNRKDTGGWGGGLRNGFLDQYWRAKDACDRAEKKWKNKVKECKIKVAAYNKRKGQCDQFQTSMDAAACKGAIMNNDACQSYSECYNNALKAYNAGSKQVRNEVVDRKAEWRGLHRMSCLIDAFSDGKVTGAEVDACKRKAVSTKPMDIKIKPAPPRAKCAISQLYPATGSYKRKEFAPLPMLAKGKESVECSGMTEISLHPRKGSPSSCKCERVTLNGAYSAKAMVKCTACTDIRKTSDNGSCPKGTKLFSPGSKSDWETFFASAGQLAAPHWIVDVTKPTGGGRRSGDAMNSGNRKQRANGWRTSDGSPWWLRNSGYGEPNGNYHANCYLRIWGASVTNLGFDDYNCNYHSKSYYCQLKRIDLKPAAGSPSSCKCQVVDLTGSYKPGKLVKCSECRDVRRSTQKSSCPAGMKIFSPTSRSDWRTFIKSAGPLNAPHFIIDVTRPSDGCQRGRGGCERSAMNSKNPKMSTWRTQDRSPWWLRSSSYGEPNGNYKANCYLHLWRTPHNTENNIQFDDADCHYHSRSYYCQPRQKSRAQIAREEAAKKKELARQKERDRKQKVLKGTKTFHIMPNGKGKYCANYIHLVRGNGKLITAGSCAALASKNSGCNPNMVFVRITKPFNHCYCVKKAQKCQFRNNNQYAIFHYEGTEKCEQWKKHPGKYSGGYVPGVGGKRLSLNDAKALCLKSNGCKAVTCGKQYGGKCTLRRTPASGLKNTPARNAETTYTPQELWRTYPGKYSGGYVSGVGGKRLSLNAAKALCLKSKGCKAVTCGRQYGGMCTLRATKVSGFRNSPARNSETTYAPKESCLK